MSGLTIRNMNKVYPGGMQAIRDFNLQIEQGEVLVVTGPEGCGKTMLLRLIAGLEDVTSGTLHINGMDVTHAEPRERNVAMIFRNSVLYPDMTVLDNMQFALRLAKMKQEEIDERVKEAAELLGLEPLFDRRPEELTVEETYRALVGRALAKRPEILLLDGMLSDLDEETRMAIRREFAKLHQKIGRAHV